MAIPMPIVQDIRRLDRQGMSRAQIARRLHVDRGTVAIVTRIWRIARPSRRRIAGTGRRSTRTRIWWTGGWRPIVCCPGSSGTRSGACTTVCWRRRTTTASIRPRCVTCTGGARRTAACRIVFCQVGVGRFGVSFSPWGVVTFCWTSLSVWSLVSVPDGFRRRARAGCVCP